MGLRASESLWARIGKRLLKILAFFFNPRLLLCVGIAWMITNGWAYVFAGIGTLLGSPWMLAVSGAYLSLLWFPFTPEKIFTLTIAIWILALLFPRDKMTLAVLKASLQRTKDAFRNRKSRRQQRKNKSPRQKKSD